MNDINKFMAEQVMGYADYKDGKAAVPVMVGDPRTVGCVDVDFDWVDWHPDTDIGQAMVCKNKFIDDNSKYMFFMQSHKMYVNGKLQVAHQVGFEFIDGTRHEKCYLLGVVSKAICEAIREAMESIEKSL